MSIDSVRHSAGVSYTAPIDIPVKSSPEAKPEAETPSIPSVQINLDIEGNKRNVEAAIAEANARLQQAGQALKFNYDETADYTVVTVQNSTTGEVVRQIPNEAVLRVAHNIEKLKGFLLDKQA